jgi:hypothetical protein
VAYAGRTRFLFGVTIAALLAGCGSGGGGAEVSFADFRTRVLAAYCRLAVICTDMPDEATCLATLQMQKGYAETLQQDTDTGKSRFDGQVAARCLSKIEAIQSCRQSEVGSILVAVAIDDACQALFAGTVAVGGGCFFHEQCASGLCQRTDLACSYSRQCCAGACADVPPPLAVGADCSALLANQTCARGSTCRAQSSGPLVCTSPVETEGAACDGPAACRFPLYCDGATEPGATGTCKRPAATGEACNPQMAQSCDDWRDVCVTETMRCTPKTPLGAACALQTCVDSGTCSNGTCVSLLMPGDACDPTFGPTCLGGAVCTNLICTLTPADGVCM